MKKVFVYKKACVRRSLDSKKLVDYFLANNFKIVNKPIQADIIIFLGCAAIDQTANISLKKVKEFMKYDAELIVAGCLPAIEPKKLKEIFKGKTLPTKNIEKIDEIFPENKIKFKDIKDPNILFENFNSNDPAEKLKYSIEKIPFLKKTYEITQDYVIKKLFGKSTHQYLSQNLYQHSLKEYYHLRISWGCTGKCTYCSIPIATGPYHSKPLNDCIREFKNGLKQGYSKFVLTAVDAGAYGIDNDNSFPKLLDELTKIPGKYEIIIWDLNPRWIVRYIDDLERILKRGKIVHIDSTIQAGSSRILKLMNRYSDVEKMKDAFIRLKKADQDLYLTTDYIIGFPSETFEESKETYNFIKECNFDVGHIFPFACKKGLKAEKIEPKITKEEIKNRIKYGKKFLNKNGYNIIFIPRPFFFVFGKK